MEFNINPVAFHLFGIPVMWYGVLIAIGIVIGSKVASDEITRRGYSEDDLWDGLIWAIIAGVICARLYYVVFEWEYYGAHPAEIFNIRGGGLAIHGALLGGILAFAVYAKKRGLPLTLFLDITAPGVILAQAIGRWGNFINQEAHGGPTDLPWGIIIDGVKVHPTFLYESIGDFLIFWILLWFARHKQEHDGEVFYLYMIFYGIVRFFVEGLRTDSLMLGSIRVAQLVSIAGILCGIFLFLRARKKNLPLTKQSETAK